MNIAKSILISIVVWLIAMVVAVALGTQASDIGGINRVFWIMGFAFVIQWVMFIPAYLWQTERYFDLTGSLTYIAVAASAWLLADNPGVVQSLVAALVIIWAIRLGSFLFSRVLRDGKDGRFDDIKPNPFRFFNVWNIQGLWVSVTAAAALAVLSSSATLAPTLLTWVGLVLWCVGFGIEVVADRQKSQFKRNPESRGEFITEGLWSRSRHPNYFGEILLWTGVAVISLPVLQGWQYTALISPVFVTLLLTRVSGIPMLEKRADERWGHRQDYQDYKAQTPVLIPALGKRP